MSEGVNILFVITIMNNTENLFEKLPYELKNIIFEYDGRIKYKYVSHVDTWFFLRSCLIINQM